MFRPNSKTWILLIAIALLCTPQGRAQEDNPEEACSAEFTPGELSAEEDSVPVRADLSEWIGEVTEISASANSGLAIGDYEADEDGSILVTIDASQAEAGTWAVTFAGEFGSCSGDVVVAEPAH